MISATKIPAETLTHVDTRFIFRYVVISFPRQYNFPTFG
jgi:hypothetical protein